LSRTHSVNYTDEVIVPQKLKNTSRTMNNQLRTKNN